MANAVYAKFKKALMNGSSGVNLITGNVKFVLLAIGGSNYNYAVTDEFLTDIPSGARVSISGVLTGPSISDLAAFTTDPGRFVAATGVECAAVAMFVDTGSPSTSRLIAYFDTGITGLPVTPSGSNYNIIPESGPWFIL